MDLKELRNKNISELKDVLNKTTKEYEKVVTDILQNKEKNVKKSSGLKKDIARIKTVLNTKLKEKNNE